MKTPKELMEEIDKRTWTTKVKILEAIRQRDAEVLKIINDDRNLTLADKLRLKNTLGLGK